MDSKDDKIWCEHCKTEWEMDYYGQLHCINGDDTFNHVPDWYRWERENVKEEVRSGNYYFEDTVRIDELVSSRIGFETIGEAKMVHDYNGITLTSDIKGQEFYLNKPIESMASVHIEYDFKKRGVQQPADAIDIATLDNTWFVFPQTAKNPLTKIHFAVEELYKMKKGE
jgi:hypothetical protein